MSSALRGRERTRPYRITTRLCDRSLTFSTATFLHFYMAANKPVARTLEAGLSAKLESTVFLSFKALIAFDLAGGAWAFGSLTD